MELVKEAGRLALLALVSWALTEGVLVNLIGQFVKVDTALKTQIIGFLTVVLKALDRWLHETGKAEKGITRF